MELFAGLNDKLPRQVNLELIRDFQTKSLGIRQKLR